VELIPSTRWLTTITSSLDLLAENIGLHIMTYCADKAIKGQKCWAIYFKGWLVLNKILLLSLGVIIQISFLFS